jgi:hypothetical protein
LPRLEKMKKSELLGYSLYSDDMPLTNPATITDELDKAFLSSDYNVK